MNKRVSTQAFRLCGLILAFVLILSGCGRGGARTSEDLWSEFAIGMLSAAQGQDSDALVDQFSVTNIAEIREVFRQIAEVEGAEAVFNDEITDAKMQEIMAEDVKLFVTSYEDLLDGEPVSYSSRGVDLKEGRLCSAIIWVRKNGNFHGILIDQVLEKLEGIKVIQWVPSSWDDCPGGGTLAAKKAILECASIGDCTYPTSGMRYKIMCER